MIKMLRTKDVLESLNIGKTSLYQMIHDGLIPPAVSLGNRAVAWPDYEVEAVLKAMIAGKSQDDIKELVNQLVEQRTNPTN